MALVFVLAASAFAECSAAHSFTEEHTRSLYYRWTGRGVLLQGHYLHVGVSERLHLGTYEYPPNADDMHQLPGHLMPGCNKEENWDCASGYDGVGVQVDPDCWGTGNPPAIGDYNNVPGHGDEYTLHLTGQGGRRLNIICGRGWACGTFTVDARGNANMPWLHHTHDVPMEDISTETELGAVGKTIHRDPASRDDYLEITQTVSFNVESRSFKTTVQLCNLLDEPLLDVKYAKSCMPRPELKPHGSSRTFGQIKAQMAHGDPYTYVCAFGEIETPRPAYCYYTTVPGSVAYRGGGGIWYPDASYFKEENAQLPGYELTGNNAIAIMMPAGDIAAGECATVEFWTVTDDDPDAAVASGDGPGGAPPTPAPTVSEYYGKSCQLDTVLTGINLDPEDLCVVGENGWATFDHDSFDSEIELTIEKKGPHTDAHRKEHGETVGALSDFRETDARYILACPQAEGEKTVQFKVRRPANLTEFGGEWLQLFPKDSWENITNEYEPYSFNRFGAKIPLAELRFSGTPADLEDEGVAKEDVEDLLRPYSEDFIVYMEVAKEGDYEVKYGNPRLKFAGKWIANEFKSTLLRVGTPWADCSGDELPTEAFDVSAIVPATYGHPNLNRAKYSALVDELKDSAVDVWVILEVFNAEVKDWTSSTKGGDYTKCYEAGNPCPEGHRVCRSEYCELDTFKQIVADLKGSSEGKVKVLGQVDAGTAVSEYDELNLDGFYFVDPTAVPEVKESLMTVVATGQPLFDDTLVEKADVFVTLLDDADSLGVWTPFSWYPSVAPSKWAAMVSKVPLSADARDPVSGQVEGLVDILIDRGYGNVFLTTEADFTNPSPPGFTASLLAALSTAKSGSGRRLSERGLDQATFWGCDDTKFECKPSCYRRTGVVTTKVADRFCSDAPLDPCSCGCFWDARWTCRGGEVACEAREGAAPAKVVGDLVCKARGTPKPSVEDCEPLPTLMNDAPSQQCLEQWATTPAPAAAAGKEEEFIFTLESSAAILSLVTLFN